MSAFGPVLFFLTLGGLLAIGLQHGGPEVAAGVLVVALLAVAGGAGAGACGRPGRDPTGGVDVKRSDLLQLAVGVPLVGGAMLAAVAGVEHLLAGGALPGWLLVAAAVALLLHPAGRLMTGHVHGGDRPTIARHEAGHAAAARALGGRVTSAVVYPGDRGGLVQARIPAGPLAAVTFLAAGELAAGTSRGCSGDQAAVRRELRGLPGGERARITRQARADAAWIVRRDQTRIRRDAEILDAKGRL